MLVSPREETFGFRSGEGDIEGPDSISNWSDAVEHAATHGLALWVHIDPWTIANAKARIAAIHTVSRRMLRPVESRRVTAEQRVYFTFS